jgi:hypothetical protein
MTNRFQIFILILFFLFAECIVAAEHVVIICPQNILPPLKNWIKYRTEQGYIVHVFSVQSPQVTPEYIKEQIQQLAEQVPLSAVLLIGKKEIPPPKIPCRIVQHFGKETDLASDDWYADLNCDGLADIAIGRIAVNTSTELEQQLRKTIQYETEMISGDWIRRLQIVAGIGRFSPLLDGVIESAVRYALTETIPESYQTLLLHADWKSPFCPAPQDYQKELTETLNRSPLFWAYFGHGHPFMLDPLVTPLGYLPSLRVDDFPKLHCRNAFPVVLLFCCYGGILDTEKPSMAEKMMFEPEGPVAVLAASGTTMPYGMSILGVEFFQEYLKQQSEPDKKPLTLGRLLLNAKRQTLQPLKKNSKQSIRQRSIRENLEIMAKTFDPMPKQLHDQLADHIAMFHLFGDPLLRLPVPQTIRLNCPAKIKSGGTLRLNGSFNGSSGDTSRNINGTMTIELVPAMNRISTISPLREEFLINSETRQSNNNEYLASNKRTICRFEVFVSNDSFLFDLPIPSNAQGGYVVRVFYSAKNDSAIGCVPIFVSAR